MTPCPIEVILLRYREHFHLSWEDCRKTPWAVILNDMQILSIEANLKNQKSNKK